MMYYTTEQIADLLNIEKTTVTKAIRDKKLNATFFGKSYRILEKDLQEWCKLPICGSVNYPESDAAYIGKVGAAIDKAPVGEQDFIEKLTSLDVLDLLSFLKILTEKIEIKGEGFSSIATGLADAVIKTEKMLVKEAFERNKKDNTNEGIGDLIGAAHRLDPQSQSQSPHDPIAVGLLFDRLDKMLLPPTEKPVIPPIVIHCYSPDESHITLCGIKETAPGLDGASVSDSELYLSELPPRGSWRACNYVECQKCRQLLDDPYSRS